MAALAYTSLSPSSSWAQAQTPHAVVDAPPLLTLVLIGHPAQLGSTQGSPSLCTPTAHSSLPNRAR
ncbi:hypothetical protein F5888DRAFT_1809889 [Russula emetica]|nr:hypothetical protein F5888DRAFT_1809889 [Russula emetica]